MSIEHFEEILRNLVLAEMQELGIPEDKLYYMSIDATKNSRMNNSYLNDFLVFEDNFPPLVSSIAALYKTIEENNLKYYMTVVHDLNGQVKYGTIFTSGVKRDQYEH